MIQNGVKIYLTPEQLFIKKINSAKVESNNITSASVDTLSTIEKKIISITKNKFMTISELMDIIGENRDLIIEQIAVMELEGEVRSLPGGRISSMG